MRVEDLGFRVSVFLEFKVEGPRENSLGLKIWGSGFGVWDLGFGVGVWVLGWRVEN